jgi:hypothetical protein
MYKKCLVLMMLLLNFQNAWATQTPVRGDEEKTKKIFKLAKELARLVKTSPELHPSSPHSALAEELSKLLGDDSTSDNQEPFSLEEKQKFEEDSVSTNHDDEQTEAFLNEQSTQQNVQSSSNPSKVSYQKAFYDSLCVSGRCVSGQITECGLGGQMTDPFYDNTDPHSALIPYHVDFP